MRWTAFNSFCLFKLESVAVNLLKVLNVARGHILKNQLALWQCIARGYLQNIKWYHSIKYTVQKDVHFVISKPKNMYNNRNTK